MATSPDSDAAAPALRERARRREGRAALLLFRAGGERWAAELAVVEEALDLARVAVMDVPGLTTRLRGVVRLRGGLVPVFSAAELLGLAHADANALLVIAATGGRAALLVDDVDDVLHADLAELRDAPGAAGAHGALVGVLPQPEGIVGVLDLPSLVTVRPDLPTEQP